MNNSEIFPIAGKRCFWRLDNWKAVDVCLCVHLCAFKKKKKGRESVWEFSRAKGTVKVKLVPNRLKQPFLSEHVRTSPISPLKSHHLICECRLHADLAATLWTYSETRQDHLGVMRECFFSQCLCVNLDTNGNVSRIKLFYVFVSHDSRFVCAENYLLWREAQINAE